MDVGGAVAFWSYAHQDNERDGGGLTRLAAHLQDEFALVTGESLNLFLDRNDISWGTEWRRRIDTALVETTFFIPVVTPLYFKRTECRRELLSFVGQAQSLGAIELVMPILYVDVSDLTAESADEARALIARMQYSDWREIRLCAENSAEYRREVHALAVRLAEISSRYEQIGVNDGESLEEAAGEVEEEGIFDLLATLQDKISFWQENIDESNLLWAQIIAIADSYTERIKKITGPGSKATGAVLSILRKMVSEIEPLLRRDIDFAKTYFSTSVEIDPMILTLLRKLEIYPEAAPVVLAALSPIDKVFHDLEKEEALENDSPKQMELFERYKGVSKDILRTTRLVEAGERYSKDANSLLKNWHQEILRYTSKEQPAKD